MGLSDSPWGWDQEWKGSLYPWCSNGMVVAVIVSEDPSRRARVGDVGWGPG